MLEALIVLMVFAVLLLGVLYLPRLYGTGLAALASARRCAMQHAATGCDEAAIPEACAGFIESSTEAAPESDVLRDASDAKLADLPVLSQALEALFGTVTWASVSASVPGPQPPAEKSIVVGASFHVLCNSTPTSPTQLAKDLFSKWWP